MNLPTLSPGPSSIVPKSQLTAGQDLVSRLVDAQLSVAVIVCSSVLALRNFFSPEQTMMIFAGILLHRSVPEHVLRRLLPGMGFFLLRAVLRVVSGGFVLATPFLS